MKSTYGSFVIAFLCGTPGAGKSYCMVRDVVERLLSSFQGKVVTNLPLNVDVLSEYVGKKLGVDPSVIAARIVLLSRETMGLWRAGSSGPWELKADGGAQGNDLLIDEIHNFCPNSGEGVKARSKAWTDWLGEVRHEGWRRLVFISQDESKVGKPITSHAEMRFELTNAERRRDPLGIPLSYWYELRASFTREYHSTISVVEYRRSRGKLMQAHVERMTIDPFWFGFYRSYEASGGGAGTGAAGEAPKREFQRRPVFLPKRIAQPSGPDGAVGKSYLWAPVWLWVLKSNWFRFARAGVVVGFLVWLTAFGGLQTLFRGIGAAGKPTAKTAEPKDPVAAKEPTVADEFKPGVKEAAPTGESVSGRHPAANAMRDLIQRLPAKDRAMVIQELRAGSDDYRALLSQKAALESHLEKMKTSVKVVALTEREAWFTDPPCSCQVGKEMYDGPYKGRLVKKIDVNNGYVELSDGVRLFVGRGVEPPGVSPDKSAGSQQSSAAGSPGAAAGKRLLPVPVRGVGGTAKPTTSSGVPKNDNDIGAGDGLNSLLTAPSVPVGPVGGSGGVGGGENDNGRAAQSTDK